jgi:Reverse transcriptase (RNA-dependent DNA polymerase)
LGRRIREGLTTGNPHCFQVDKPDRTKRPFVYLDPIAQLYFRAITTGAISPMLQNLSKSTIHVRPTMLSNCWQAEAWRTAQEHKRSRLAEAKLNLSAQGKGFHAKFDVANHYPTVSLKHLCFLLQSIQVPESTLNHISDFVSSLHAFNRLPPGLPTGPEASAILGTAVLIPVDRALGELDVFSATRWMDDIEVFDPSHEKLETAIARVREVLNCGGQVLNDSKTSITPIEQVQLSEFEPSGTQRMTFLLNSIQTFRQLLSLNNVAATRNLSVFRISWVGSEVNKILLRCESLSDTPGAHAGSRNKPGVT